MGWHIQTNYKDKWEIFSIVVGDVIASFKTEDELAKWIAKQEIYRAKLQAIEEVLTFPHRWVVNGKARSGNTTAYREWLISLKYTTEEEKFKLIDEKLEELMK